MSICSCEVSLVCTLWYVPVVKKMIAYIKRNCKIMSVQSNYIRNKMDLIKLLATKCKMFLQA